MLEKSSLTYTYPARTRRLSEGVFWFVIAATILLALLAARIPMQAPLPRSAAWAGVFALYYAVRLALTRRHWLAAQQESQSGWHGGLQRLGALLLPLLLDLLVITCLVALSGGWASPLYLLYLGWAAALLDVPSMAACLWLSGLACGAFMLGGWLAAQQPFSALHIALLAEHALLLLAVTLGISGVNVYVAYTKSGWEAERRQWDGLRQVVFAQLSHELYTPLSAIRASAALAVEDVPGAERQHLLRVIERNCVRMHVLLDDLLALWKEPQRQFHYAPRRLACLPVAEAVGQMLGPLLVGRQQRLVVAAEPQRVSVLADQDRLEQVLVNLLVNAHKYAPPETVITLRISGQDRDVLFAVHDEGEGVPLEEQGHLFEVFYRGTNSLASSRGSGLGLALAKALVVLQGGQIWVESVPGSGSTFYFTLPAAQIE
jgi:signal transduction histidine kinase